MVVDIISASDEIADTEDPDTKKEAIQKLKNTFKDKVSEFMNAYKRLRADAKKLDHNLDDKFDKISEELEKLLGAGIDYTKAYIKHHKKEKNLILDFSVIYLLSIGIFIYFGIWLFAFTNLFIILKGGIFLASFFGLGYLFHEAMDRFNSKHCFDSMDKPKTDGLDAIKSIKEESESIIDKLDMTFVATGKFIKTLNDMSDAVDALYDAEV